MSKLFPNLFSDLNIRGKRIRNRIISTGHHTLLARNGKATDELIAYHRARAAGGTGLIILECTAVHESAFFHSTVINGFDKGCIPGFRKIAEAAHENGATVFGQLFHPGTEVFGIAGDGTRTASYAPSQAKHERYLGTASPMTAGMIRDVIDGYASTARHMIEAGLDGVEVVASHGYLPAQFLNPRINRRTDAFGGPFENRIRFLMEIVSAVRKAIGDEPVLGLRISGHEEDNRGLQPSECMEAIEALERARAFDYYNVTAGTSGSARGVVHVVPAMSFAPGYVAPYARMVKDRVGVPVFITGRINQPHVAEDILRRGDADMCGMTRAQICDPDMANKARADRTDDIRACVGCNQACIGHLYLGAPVSCIQHPETGRELEVGRAEPARCPKKVVVIGAGPAGMKAAIVARKRGHDVTLLEKSRQLGGQILLAQLLPGRAEFGGIVNNLRHELQSVGVKVELGITADAPTIRSRNPDHLVVATGALPYMPDLEMSGGRAAATPWQVLKGEVYCGTKVAIADWRGDWIALGLAEKLVREGRQVTLFSSAHTPGVSLVPHIRDTWVSELAKLGVRFVNLVRLFGADETDAYFEHTYTGEAVICESVDTVIGSFGNASVPATDFDLPGIPTHVIGDAYSPRTVEEAILEGMRAGLKLG
ncbi:FAD-dependent oxidoreductase [Aquamicrobium defluvii]|uniref:oxidoreductase n=1 Tax=Aquamicrobium defluvii TaxID=69279 RepID=UPI000558A730|nr:FAD-dependent oxidoreductase [Aquamicrobium defluvii]